MKKEIRNYEENKISHTAWSDQPDRCNRRRQHICLPDEHNRNCHQHLYVGNVNFDDDPLTGGLSESKVARDENSNLYVDADGTGEWTVKENKYEDLVAGEVVYKDPTVHMADDSQDAWVFAKIVNENPELTITYASDWVDVTDAYKTAQNLNNIDYKVYAKKDVISKSAHSTIFEEVTVGNNVTENTTFTDIKVSACAVQAAGFANYTDALAQVSFN